MSHRYGERALPGSRDLTVPSSPLAPGLLLNEEKYKSRTLRPGHSDMSSIDKYASAKISLSSTELFSFSVPSSGDLKRKSLTDLRSCLREIVIKEQRAPRNAREKLEALRLSLIEQVTRLERAEQKSKDAARRVVIGRDVMPPPPDPIETSWRKKRFGPNSRRSGPAQPLKRTKNKEEEEEAEENNPDYELHSTRWKLKGKLILQAQDRAVRDTGEWNTEDLGELEEFGDVENEDRLGEEEAHADSFRGRKRAKRERNEMGAESGR